VHGFLYLPLESAGTQRPPVLLALHGGPAGQEARPTYDPAFQYLLARGIAVFDLNFRGSGGYGRRFERLDDRRLRPNAVKDMAAAVDWLATTGKVDASRVALMGNSYGGFMTLAALTQWPGKFKAGVAFSPASNWVMELENAPPMMRPTDRVEYGDVNDPEDRAFFVALSPITHVAALKARLMVLQGAEDPRVSVSETDQLVGSIRALGGKVDYLRFPDEGHDIRYGAKLSNRIIAFRRVAAFLESALTVGAEPR
jgi:dipeptidyl aminopeptidase/acylaminoacyl peptidase